MKTFIEYALGVILLAIFFTGLVLLIFKALKAMGVMQ
jgi:hypothetical protein